MSRNRVFRSVLLAAGFGLAAATSAIAADPPAPAATSAPANAPAETPAASPPATSAEKPAAAPAANNPTPAKELSPEAKTEAEAASQLEKKFQDAARSYRQVKKNGETMYCKKEKPIGSTIPRMQCISEAQLRLQVEQMDELRDRMRNSSKCTMGPGCAGGS